MELLQIFIQDKEGESIICKFLVKFLENLAPKPQEKDEQRAYLYFRRLWHAYDYIT